MAREHARIWLDINGDDDFRRLSFDAQAFYTRIILTEATLNYAGVADWRPKRLTVRAPDLALARIIAAATELEAGRYLLFDLDTEEVLARSYIRRDELLRNPKMAATVIKAYSSVASPVLRAAIVTEVKRIHDEHPDYSSWSHKDTADGLARMLSRPALADGEYVAQFTYAESVPNTDTGSVKNTYPQQVSNTNPDAVQNSNPDTGAEHQSKSVPNPSTSTLHPSPAPLEGYVSTEGNQGAEPDPNGPRPSDRCERHRGLSNPPACRACADARHRAEAWDTAHAAAETERRQRFTADLRGCDDCDEHGWVLDEDPESGEQSVSRCPRHDWGQR